MAYQIHFSLIREKSINANFVVLRRWDLGPRWREFEIAGDDAKFTYFDARGAGERRLESMLRIAQERLVIKERVR